jgi:uncharacterized protein involved in exopolysaccharide biosynthesis
VAPTAETSQLDAAVAETNSAVTLEAEWQRLVRTVGETRTLHDDIRHRADNANLAAFAAEAAAKDLMTIVDPPTLATRPSSGNRGKVALIGLVFALLLGVGYAAGRVALDDTIVDVADLEALGLLSVLGTLPKIDNPEALPFTGGHSAEEQQVGGE